MKIRVSEIACKLLCVLSLVVLATFPARAHAQSLSIAGGTLEWTVTSQNNIPCNYEGFTFDEWNFSSFKFQYGSTTYPINGSTVFFQDNNSSTGCPPAGPQPFEFPLPAGIGASSGCLVNFTAENGGAGSAVVTTTGCAPSGNPGFIAPKYVVVGVTYAPPGSASFVQYSNTTSVGNTTTISNSFSNGVGFSVTDTMGGNISAGFWKGDFTITATESTDYTQGSSSSKTLTVSKASNVSYTTPGTPTEAPVNSDYDYIWLWLNPELFVNYTPPAGSNPASVVLTGYGMDPNDPATGLPQTGVPYTAGPDVIEVQVGCLNGHFSCGSDLVWSAGEAPGSFITSGLLARSWQSAAKGYYWPTGEQSGLSFNDVCQILSFDPLAKTPSKCTTPNDYTSLNSLPSTTSDGRFSKIPYPPNPVQYPVGGATELYSLVQTNTQSTSTGNTHEIKQAFSVSEQFKTSAFWGLVSNSLTFKQSDTLTWDYSSLNTLTTTTTLTNELSITGPPDIPTYPSNEPVEFIGYQDNTFGTFAFVPVDYCPSGSILCTQ